MWVLWGTVGELWELFEVDLRLGSGGATRELCERLGKQRWIAVKVVGVTQGSVIVRAEEFQGCPIIRWW
jgi:hypothetical protein